MSEFPKLNWSAEGELVNQLQNLVALSMLIELREINHNKVKSVVSDYLTKYQQYGGNNPKIIKLLKSDWTVRNFVRKYTRLKKLVYEEPIV